MKSIILVAPPSGGKGTQAKLLSEFYHIPHISTGDLLRNEVSMETFLGKKIADIMKQGNLVSDEIITKLLENRLNQNDCDQGFILDGYPRNIAQMVVYNIMLEKLNKTPSKVIFLDITEELALKRAISRITCGHCGQSYNMLIDSLKPKVAGICNKCGSDLKVRDDDNEKTFRQRYQVFMDNTKSLIDAYARAGVLTTIKVTDNKSVNDIFDEIRDALND